MKLSRWYSSTELSSEFTRVDLYRKRKLNAVSLYCIKNTALKQQVHQRFMRKL